MRPIRRLEDEDFTKKNYENEKKTNQSTMTRYTHLTRGRQNGKMKMESHNKLASPSSIHHESFSRKMDIISTFKKTPEWIKFRNKLFNLARRVGEDWVEVKIARSKKRQNIIKQSFHRRSTALENLTKRNL